MTRVRRRGSLTVEAALVLPLLMSGMLALISLILMWHTGQRLQMLLAGKAQELAMECADGRSISLTDVREDIANGLTEEDIRFIRNGRDGIDLSGSDADNGEYIDLCVRCELIPLTDMFGLLSLPFERRCLVHAWCGYISGYFPDKEYVYITQDSEVYHTDRDCTHLRLTVKETSSREVGDLRNDDGRRYRPCEICHAKLSDGKLYITSEGDRYHNSITCSALKRTVWAVRIDRVKGRRPCSRCAGK